jgi:hypothetical protein
VFELASPQAEVAQFRIDDAAAVDDHRGAALEEARSAIGLIVVSRLIPAFTATRVTAPTIPPSSELSLPMTAFCTTLDNKKMTMKSNVFIAASPRLPVNRNNTISRAVLSVTGLVLVLLLGLVI